MAGVTSNPKVTIQLLPAAVVDAFADRRDLIVGQLVATATAVSGSLVQDVHAMSAENIRTLFGVNSDLTHRILMWQQGNGSYSPLDVIGIAELPGEAQAASTITVTGTATSDGALTIAAVDARRYSVNVSVSSGDVQNDIAAAINTAIGNLIGTNQLNPPFTTGVATNVVTLTSVDRGPVANDYGVRITGSVPGVTVALTAFSGGGAAPTLTTILDPIAGLRYTGMNWPEAWSANLAIAVDEMDDRFNASNAILDGVVFNGNSDTFANLRTFVSTRNSQSLVVGGNNTVDDALDKGPAILQPADWVLCYFMGVRSRRLTPNAPVADFVVSTSGPLDAVGGPHNASLPYFNTPLARTPVTLPANLFSPTEQNTLEEEGVTSYGINPAGNRIIMGPAVTTWTTDAAGNDNVSFHYLNYVDTGSACREVFFNNLRATYSQSRLTEGDLVPGRAMANAESIKSELLRVYRVLAALALTQAGREAESFFSVNTTVTINLATRTATVAGPLPIVTQLGVINYSLQFSFTVGQTGTQITF